MIPGPIYQPKGRAREYARLAINYYDGCDHGCSYCYCGNLWKDFNVRKEESIGRRQGFSWERLDRQLTNPPKEEVLLCFAGDPYCQANDREIITRRVLVRLLEAGVPTRVLTKGGARCMSDLDVFLNYERQGVPLSVGASLTFLEDHDSKLWEPGAARPRERLAVLRRLHELGVRTWASCEPVVDPHQTLSLISYARDFVDEWKIGKLNHRPDIESTVDWRAFGVEVVKLLQEIGKPFYIKQDLRRHLPDDLQQSLEASGSEHDA